MRQDTIVMIFPRDLERGAKFERLLKHTFSKRAVSAVLTALSPNRLLLRVRKKKLLYIIELNKAAAGKKNYKS